MCKMELFVHYLFGVWQSPVGQKESAPILPYRIVETHGRASDVNILLFPIDSIVV